MWNYETPLNDFVWYPHPWKDEKKEGNHTLFLNTSSMLNQAIDISLYKTAPVNDVSLWRLSTEYEILVSDETLTQVFI